jgi:hypothetical protein
MATTTTTKAQKSSTHRSPQGYTNNDTTLNETQRKYKDTHRGLMCPTGPALSHPAAPMLKKFATEGYPTESTYEWNLAELDDAVEMGPPPVSTRDRRSKSLQKGSIGKSGARFLQPDTVENTSETFPDVLKEAKGAPHCSNRAQESILPHDPQRVETSEKAKLGKTTYLYSNFYTV